ncbi:SRPBCC family protein [Nakamurella lactea]|uniref:SRPBCC family protein n=1 Tax=Nakamurella lactea TaxID=459515 RepID=UPI0003FACD19|nr:SRPBCC family protein [Nakamurella lactea]
MTTVERDGKQLSRLIASRRYPAEIDDVWDALTDRERIPRWFLPVTGDLKVGGRYQFEGNAGGVVLGCRPPRELAATWEMGEQISYVTVTLEPDGDRTLLTLHHDAEVDPGMAAQFGPGAVGIGWELGLIGLAEHLASGAPVDPVAAQQWVLSAEGIEAVTAISRGWADADIAFGVDPDQAEAASQACIAFYTTVPDTTVPDGAATDNSAPDER